MEIQKQQPALVISHRNFNKRKIDFIEKINHVDMKKIEQVIGFII